MSVRATAVKGNGCDRRCAAATNLEIAIPLASSAARVSWLDHLFVVGLAGVFLINAVVALIQPGDFTGLVARSSLARWAHLDRASWMGGLIAVNDLVVAAALLAVARFRRWRPAVLAWTGMWLLAVTFIKLTALGAA